MKHNTFGYSLEEWLTRLPNELPYDAVGMWQIIPALREEFNLEGNELIKWVYRGILALLNNGALPVRGSAQTKRWVYEAAYGDIPEAIADSIIAEWQTTYIDPQPYDSLWFALPEMIRAGHDEDAS